MRLLTIIFLLLPTLAYSQKNKGLSTQLLAEIKINDLIVSPDDYLLNQSPANIDYIEFVREVNFSNTDQVYAVISSKDGFDKDYSIGQIIQYQRSETQVGYFITVHLKDGTSVSKHQAFDFSNGAIPESDEYEPADYDVEGTPFNGTWDGIEVVAL
jgi:hypothetical protein